MSNVANSLRVSPLRRLTWPHPEWWALGLCFMAWWLILFRALSGASSHGHVHHGVPAMMHPGLFNAWLDQVLWWLVMLVAMMFPLLTSHIRNIAARSLWRRRHRAIGIFLAGYVAPWMVFGAVATGALVLFEIKPALVVAGFFVAIVWQVLAVRRRAVLACHRTRPIAPNGWGADRDCLRYGWMIGSTCVVSCWSVMLVCLLSGHSLPVMIGMTGIILWERLKPRTNQLYFCVIILVLAIITLAGIA